MNAPKPIKLKKCCVCKEQFPPFRTTQRVCSPTCAVSAARAIRERQERKELREAKIRIKTKAQWLREAQAAFNAYVRLRDQADGCISCGRQHQGQWHAGHYRSVGSCPELRFTELQVHKQCQPCNNHLSGNIVNYRINLIKKIGVQAVEWIEGKHEPLKLTIPEIQQIKRKYQLLAKALEQST